MQQEQGLGAIQPIYSIEGGPRPHESVCRRDKSLSALAHELISKYGQEGSEIDLDEVQVREQEGLARRSIRQTCEQDTRRDQKQGVSPGLRESADPLTHFTRQQAGVVALP